MNFKSFSRSLLEHFFLTVGQNNFGKKIPFLLFFFSGENEFNDVAKYIQNMYIEKSQDKLIYTHMTCATDKNNLAVVFNAVQDYILFSRLKSIGVM